MRQKDAQHTPSVCVCGVEWASASAGHDQAVHGTSGGEGIGEHELEWSYLRGRDDYVLCRNIRDTTAEGCWMEGTLMELRQSQAAGKEGPGA
jgi:hypothetical protein